MPSFNMRFCWQTTTVVINDSCYLSALDKLNLDFLFFQLSCAGLCESRGVNRRLFQIHRNNNEMI